MKPAKVYWESPDTFASVLAALFIDKFGIEAFAGNPETGEDPWDPVTIQLEIDAEYGIRVRDGALSKLLALQLHTITNGFYARLSHFIRICNVLSGAVSPSADDPADVDEILWGMTEAMLFDPPDEPEPFSIEIRRYIGEKLKDEGFLQAPDLLQIAIRNDNWQGVLQQFADRPEDQQRIREAAQAKYDELMQMLRTRLKELFEQLKDLPLENTDTRNLLEGLIQPNTAK